MKYFKILTILLFTSTITFYSCKDKTKTTKTPEQETLKPMGAFDSSAQPNATTTNPTTTEPAQNLGGVWHYTCSNGCVGGAGSAVNCNSCGSLLAHNSGYHADTNSQTTTPSDTPKPAEPSQNSAGVWHYTCGNGCAGGAGSASACGSCGETLAHNSSYH